MSHYTAEIAWHPVFELVSSLQAFVDPRLHKVIDLGAAWRSEVRRRLRPTFLDRLQAVAKSSRMESVLSAGAALAWVWHERKNACGEGTIEGFLAWAEDLALGDLFSIMSEMAPPGEDVRRDLAEVKNEAETILQLWHNHFFKHLDPAILSGLALEADSRRSIASTFAPENLVEEVSGHVFVKPDESLSKVVLIPQYHARPWNVFFQSQSILFLFYPAEALPPIPGEPPEKLVRLTKALSDPSRLRILRFVSGGARSFKDITHHTGLTKATVHYHMVLLRAAGLIRVETSLKKHGDMYSLRRSALSDLPKDLDSFIG